MSEVRSTGWRASTPSVGYRDVLVGSGANVTGQNFGDTQKVPITGNVFNDANNNGAKNTGENGLSGWRVYLDLNNDGHWQSTEPSQVTDASGNYTFRGLSAGTFRLRMLVPSTHDTTTPSSGLFTFSLTKGQSATKVFGEHHV